jgi:hypothetical protein
MTYEREAIDRALADKLGEAVEHVRQAIEVIEASKLQAVLHLTLSTSLLQTVEKALRTGEQPAEKPAANVVPFRKVAAIARNLGYPPGWPKCRCGLPTLDGHLTCGNVACDESGARSERHAQWMERTHGGPDDAG